MKILREFRNEQKKTREQMAQLLGISLSLYNLVECDVRQPSKNFLDRFKKAFPSFDMNIFFQENLYK